MRIHHFLGGLSLAFTAAGLGTMLAEPILAAVGRAADAQSAREIGRLFFVPSVLPAMITIVAILRGKQVRTLEMYIDACASLLAPRYALLTAPKEPNAIESRRWSDEVWEFRRSLPVRLPLISDRAALKIVTARISMLPAQATAPVDPEALARRTAGALLRMGWSTQIIPGRSDPFVAAQRYGIRAAALCVAGPAVTPQDVERALRAKAHARADLAAIVSPCPVAPAARALAERHEVGLLRPSQLKAVHRAAGKVWRARHRRTPAQDAAPARG